MRWAHDNGLLPDWRSVELSTGGLQALLVSRLIVCVRKSVGTSIAAVMTEEYLLIEMRGMFGILHDK